MTRPWPRRVDAALLCFAANLIAHGDRAILAVALPAIAAEYGWDRARSGWVLSGFFAGYAICMIPVGLLTGRFGPKRVFGIGMALWSAFTALTPFPASAAGLAAMRVLLGAAESGTAACINGTLVRWFPPREYSRAASLCWSAGYAGPILAIPLASLVLHHWGWRAVFWTFGGLGFLWLPFWRMLEEPAGPASTRRPAPWKSILSRRGVWAVFLLHFSSNWVLYTMITWLPSYLSAERGFSLSGAAAGASAPFLFAWIGTNASAAIIDAAGPRVGAARIRKLAMIPYAMSAAALALIPYAPDAGWTVAALCCSMLLLTAATPVFSSASLDLTPDHAGPVAAVQNAFANLAGIAAPVAIGYVTGPFGWRAAFLLTAAICLSGAAAYAGIGATRRPSSASANLPAGEYPESRTSHPTPAVPTD